MLNTCIYVYIYIFIAAEVRVRSFDLIVCIDFLLKLTMFLALPTEIDEKLPKSKVPPIVDTAARGTARMTVTTLSCMSNIIYYIILSIRIPFLNLVIVNNFHI